MEIKTEKQVHGRVIKVIRAKKLEYEGKESIVFDMQIGSITIYNNRLITGDNGTFVGFPSRKGKNNKYYAYAYTKLSQEEIESIVDQISKM